MDIDEITNVIINTSLSIHRGMGPGLLESVYEAVLAKKLKQAGIEVRRQVPVDFEYDGLHFNEGFKIDLLVEEKVIVELKSVEKVLPVHSKQVLTYLRLMKLEVGLLINFGEALLKQGIKRIVNNYQPPATSRLRVNQLGF